MSQIPTGARADKVASPVLREPPIARTGLMKKLASLHAERHVLIVAPAGFGKTTLMREYRARLHANGEDTAWLTLSSTHNDRSSLGARLRQVLSSIVRAEEEPDWGISLEQIPPCTLFLDNLHLLHEAGARELRESMAEMDCAAVRLVVAGRRGDVGVRAALGLQHGVGEINAADLAFDEVQVKACVQSRLPAAMAQAHAALLQRQTTGWPAVLQMACTAIRQSETSGSADLPSQPDGGAIAMFFTHEVLEIQPQRLQELLLDIAVASQFSMALGEHLHCAAESTTWREMLLDGGVPLQRLDAGWYRLYPPFAQHLRTLARHRNGARFVAKGRRAADWLAAHGRAAEAVETLLIAGCASDAAQRMEGLVGKLVADAKFRTVIRWCESLPAATVQASPVLCSTYVLSLAYCNHADSLASWLPRCLAQSRKPGADIAYAGAAQLVQAYELLLRGTPEQLLRARAGLENAACATAQFERGSFACVLAYSQLARSDYAGAEKSILVAKRIFREEKRMLGLAIAHYLEAVRAAAQGQLKAAVGCLEISTLLVRENQSSAARDAMDALAAGFAATLYYELDELDLAATWARRGRHDVRKPVFSDTLEGCTIVAYRMACQQGKSAEASLIMQQSQAAAHAHGLKRVAQTFALEVASHGAAGASGTEVVPNVDAGWLMAMPSPRGATCIRPSEEIHGAGIAQVRFFVSEKRYGEALAWIDGLLAHAVAHKRSWREARLRVLRCVVLQSQGAGAEALLEMAHALEIGATTGLLRTFLDEKDFVDCLRTQAGSAEPLRLSDAAARYRDRLLRHVTSKPASANEPAATSTVLSEQEMKVLDLVARGRSNKTAAEMLQLSVNTVKWHLSHIYAKLGAHSRDEAVVLARERGWVE
jgi:LuxR family transcriptional regulator, maltose regulon positive regulatory protein